MERKDKEGLVKAWAVLYSTNPILDAEAGGAGLQDQSELWQDPSPKANKPQSY